MNGTFEHGYYRSSEVIGGVQRYRRDEGFRDNARDQCCAADKRNGDERWSVAEDLRKM